MNAYLYNAQAGICLIVWEVAQRILKVITFLQLKYRLVINSPGLGTATRKFEKTDTWILRKLALNDGNSVVAMQ